MNTPSIERGCTDKLKLGTHPPKYKKRANRLATKHNKQYGVYLCPHCENTHLTTKIHSQDNYPPLEYITEL